MSATDILICPQCGMPGIDKEDKFCYRDGSELTLKLIHRCGRSLDKSDKFCPRCGEEVKSLTDKICDAVGIPQLREVADPEPICHGCEAPESKCFCDSDLSDVENLPGASYAK